MSYRYPREPRQTRPLGQSYPSGGIGGSGITTEMVVLVGGGIAVLGGLFWLSSWKRRKLRESLGDEKGEMASLGLGLLTGI